ncbi:MAG: DUF115 domain-containing protein [Lachnospiraceae bacterium]|nr:DUF115 domain-containing protein [Lachnospiraceae bacterium]
MKYFIKSRISRCIVYLTGKKKKSDRYLLKMKGKYSRKRCFVLGNGPSLTAEDLELLKDEITFASNKIYRIFEKTSWRPTFLGLMDESVAEQKGVLDGLNGFECEKKFALQESYYIFRKLKGDICFLHGWYQRKYLDNPGFSDDLTKGVYCIATVTYMLIQIARYMGFDEIYLMGIDNKYAYSKLKDGTIVRNEGVTSYFGEEKAPLPDPGTAVSTWELDVAYEYADGYSRKHGFRIYNATRGGFLEKFERVNLEDIIRK